MKPEEMIQARNKARREWLASMHLRPVYLVEEGVVKATEELMVYIAVAPSQYDLGPRRGTNQLCLVPVEYRNSMRYIAYKNRGCIFPWDDIDMATEICFKSKIAERIEELRNTYGEFKN